MRQIVVPRAGEASRIARWQTSGAESGTPDVKLDTTDDTPVPAIGGPNQAKPALNDR